MNTKGRRKVIYSHEDEEIIPEHSEETLYDEADFASLEEEFDDVTLPSAFQDNLTPTNNQNNLLAAKKNLEHQLLTSVTTQASLATSGTESVGFENIVGVGISEKVTDGQFTGEDCVTVYVVTKTSKASINPDSFVPEKINGIQTDVVATGELRSLSHVGRYRPAPGGVSVGHFSVSAGTLGCLVKRDRSLYALSNNHVLANVNKGRTGDPIVQPGTYDGGTQPRDVIGLLSEFVPLKFDGQMNKVDAAIAQVSPSLVTAQNKCFGGIKAEPLEAKRFMVAKKCGRSTELTRGIVTDTQATVRVGYGTDGSALFEDQIIIMGIPFIYPFSSPGDSGSVVLEEFSNRPLGLLFGGSSTHTIVNKMSNVLTALNVSIVI